MGTGTNGDDNQTSVAEDQLTHAEFLHDALAAAGEWGRSADPKAAGVLVVMGLGSADLVKQSHRLFDAHLTPGASGDIASWAFAVAILFAAATVFLVSVAVFPRLRPKKASAQGRSLYFFGGVAKYNDPSEYERAVRAKSPDELVSAIAEQAWQVSRIAKLKHDWTQRAYLAVLGFVLSWTVARVALAFVE